MASAQKSFGSAYELARERYAAIGVDTEAALRGLDTFPISLHCWQGDDVRGFEPRASELGGGLAVTGNYPGRARTIEELRRDVETAFRLIPGKHRLNLHAIYGDFGGKLVERDEIEARHFASWIEWAKSQGAGLDFNPTCFAHPKAADGQTLTHHQGPVREFWIRHCARARDIAATMGAALGRAAVCNVWIPDGSKDTPADRSGPRERLEASLDQIFFTKHAPEHLLDSIEPKLFGIGSESYVAGSHEFYLGYGITRQKLLCLDAGHYHPTECIADKISSVLRFAPGVLLHVSRGVRWDSDHVVTATNELEAIAREAIRPGARDRVHLGMDYFDASINRVAAWVIGARNLLRALLGALLQPEARLESAERSGDFTTRLALQEESKAMPIAAVWDEFCARKDVPIGEAWLSEIKRYESDVLIHRDRAAGC
jgi:L-rhamnose isomerase